MFSSTSHQVRISRTPYYPKGLVDLSKNTEADQQCCIGDFFRGQDTIHINGKPLGEILHDISGRNLETLQDFKKEYLNALWDYIGDKAHLDTAEKKVFVNYANRYFHQGALLNSLQAAMWDRAKDSDLILTSGSAIRQFKIITEPGCLWLIEAVTFTGGWLRDSKDKEGKKGKTVDPQEGHQYLSKGSITHRLGFTTNDETGKVELNHTIVDVTLQNQHPLTHQIFDQRTLWQQILSYLKPLFAKKDLEQSPDVSLTAYRPGP